MRARRPLALLLACLAASPARAEIPAGERRSGFEFMEPQTRAMQRDDAANPFVAFTTTATVTGLLTFTWEGDNGFSQTETATLTVVA